MPARKDERPARPWPGVTFIDGPGGRRARLAGTGRDVWEVIPLYRAYREDGARLLGDHPGLERTGQKVAVVVGGCDPLSTRLAVRLLQDVSPRVVPVSSAAAAEMTKLLENVFRNVNIALVNQVAQLCERMGLVGGHCIPVDPYYLAWKARRPTG